MTRGGYLTSIHSTVENDMLARLVSDANSNGWIGLTLTSYAGLTSWIDGTSVDYRAETVQSNTSINKYCITINGGSVWPIFTCDSSRFYICRQRG